MEENSHTAQEIEELNRGINRLLREGIPSGSSSLEVLRATEALILKALKLADPKVTLIRLHYLEQRSIHNMLKALRKRIEKVLDDILVEG